MRPTHFSLSSCSQTSSLAANDSLLIDQLEKLWEDDENGRKFTRGTERNGSSPREMRDSPDPEEFPRHKFVVDSGNGSISRLGPRGGGIWNFSTVFRGLNLGPGCRIFQLNPPCKLALAWAPETQGCASSAADIHRPTEISFCLAPSVARDVHTNTPTRRGTVHVYTRIHTMFGRICVRGCRCTDSRGIEQESVGGKGWRCRCSIGVHTNKSRPLSYALVIEGARRKLSWRRWTILYIVFTFWNRSQFGPRMT